jgi:putative exporter of polyketide antibiotics
MDKNAKPRWLDWRDTLITSSVLGFLILGIGGRFAMRAIAVIQGQAGAFSLDGSFTVSILGAGAGAVIGTIFLVARTLFARRRFFRNALFWSVVGAFVLRGLNPVSPLNLALFAPLFVLHGGLLTWWWCRRRMSHAGRPLDYPHLQSISP